eukprot:scaffold3726_cov170-Skeletonema_marinoi.AAC.2
MQSWGREKEMSQSEYTQARSDGLYRIVHCPTGFVRRKCRKMTGAKTRSNSQHHSHPSIQQTSILMSVPVSFHTSLPNLLQSTKETVYLQASSCLHIVERNRHVQHSTFIPSWRMG